MGIGISFFFQAEDGIRDDLVTGVQTCALPILQVRFDDFERLRRLRPPPPIIPEVERRLKELSRGFDIRLAATWGMRLGLAEARGNGVRFPHSNIPAYLGPPLLDPAMEAPQYSSEAP